MRQLVYVSAVVRKLSYSDLDTILNAARRNNPARDVTGMLLSIDQGFLQSLEGPPAGVENIYQRILRDNRHTGQRVLVDEIVAERLFSRWSMGFDRLNPALKAHNDIFIATREAIENAVSPEKAAVTAQLVRSFYAVSAGTYAA
jgi:hypothetical protein